MRTRAHRASRHQQYWTRWGAILCAVLGLAALVAASACRRGAPVIDLGPKPTEAHGTISGTVRGPANASAVEGRVVEVVNIDTNERQRVTTNSAGGFTFKVKPGKYRVELTLREGETIVKAPGVMNVNRSDVDAHADFVVSSGSSGASGRLTRPRAPSYRAVDHGLGSPMA